MGAWGCSVAVARVDLSEPIRRVYDRVLGQAVNVMPEFHTMRTQMNRTRHSLLHQLPENVMDVELHVGGEWSRTWDGDDFLLHQVNDWGVLVSSLHMTT